MTVTRIIDVDLSIINLLSGRSTERHESNGQGSEVEYHANEHVEPLVLDRQDH